MNSEYNLLVKRINSFIDNYYKNLSINGLILFLLLMLIIIISISLFELFGFFSSSVRLFLLLFAIFSIILIFGFSVFIPILRLLNLSKRLTHRKAAIILQKNFPEIHDQLINLLELKKIENNSYSIDLLIASIEQKTANLKTLNFNQAIDKNDFRRLLKYFVIIFLLSIILVFIKPEILTKGANHIIHYKVLYQKDYGFIINVDTSNFIIERGRDLQLDIFLEGERFPNELFVNYGGNVYLTKRIKHDHFQFIFKKVNQSFTFRIGNSYFKSNDYSIKTYNSPLVKSYSVNIEFPEYVNKENVSLTNFSDLLVPKGSLLDFKFVCDGVDTVFFINDTLKNSFFRNGNEFVYRLKATNNEKFTCAIKNSYCSKEFLQNCKINVIPDFFPEIEIQEKNSGEENNLIYFKGFIKDDYGFTNLYFVSYEIGEKDSVAIEINKNINIQEFYFQNQFQTKPEIKKNEISYYFIVYDNDQNVGPKFTKSNTFRYIVPSLSEISELKQKKSDELFRKLEESSFLAKDIKNDIFELKKKMLDNNLSNWEKVKTISSIEEKKQTLENLLNEIVNVNREKLNFNSSSENEELLEKQKLVDQLLKELMDDEMKKLLDEISNMKNELDREQFDKLGKDITLKMDDLEKEVDKNLELLKRMKISDDVSKVSENLKYLADRQKELSEREDTISIDTLTSENEVQKNFFKKINEQYNNALEENKNLKKPENLNPFNEEFQNTENGLNENQQNLNDNKREKFKESSKQSAMRMDDLAQKIKNMLEQNSQDQEGENADAIRQILDNLMELSFEQEKIIDTYSSLDNNSPVFNKYLVEEKQLFENFEIIRDSLYQLSKRTAYLGNNISNTAFGIDDNIIKSVEFLNDRNKYRALQLQRNVFKLTNDLILLLSESLKNMENMSGGEGSSKQKSKKQKPSKGEQSLSEMRKSQEDLKNQMKQMLEQMKSAKAGGIDQKLKEGLAKSIMMSEVYQKMLNELMNNSSNGKETTKKLEEIKKLMEENKNDIFKSKLSNKTLDRQQNIITRLLDAENAEREREKDERRESKEAENIKKMSPKDFFSDENNKENFNDVIQKNYIQLNYFYKSKFQEYLNNINKVEP
jgi:hypothetical protein